jgi:hypothetical protein
VKSQKTYLHIEPPPIQMNSQSPRVGSLSACCLSRPSPCHLRGGVSLISSQPSTRQEPPHDQPRQRTHARTHPSRWRHREERDARWEYVRAEVGALKEPPQVEEGLWDLVLAGQKPLVAQLMDIR